MITKNGHWMDPRFAGRMKLNLQQFADGGEGGDPGADTGDNGDNGGAGDAGNGGNNADQGGEDGADNLDALNAEIARLKAEMATQKKALDAATSEAGKYRRELKSKMTQEQIAEAEKQEAAEKAAQELENLRKEVAKGKTVKSLMGKLSLSEEEAGELADHMYGAADIDTALLLIQKAWMAKEKALRMEFGKIPGPGAGGSSEDKEMEEALKLAKELGKRRAVSSESVRDQLKGLVR